MATVGVKGIWSSPEIFVGDAVRLAEVTVEVLFSEVTQQIVVVEVTLVAELAQRMSFVRAVVLVADAPVMTKLGAIVTLPVYCE